MSAYTSINPLFCEASPSLHTYLPHLPLPLTFTPSPSLSNYAYLGIYGSLSNCAYLGVDLFLKLDESKHANMMGAGAGPLPLQRKATPLSPLRMLDGGWCPPAAPVHVTNCLEPSGK